MSQINDLLEDLEFIRWVKNPDDELTTFWNNWMQANPDRVEDLKFAREIIKGMEFPSISPSEQLKSEVLTAILKETPDVSAKLKTQDINQKSSSGTRIAWKLLRIAAMISGMVLLSYVILNWNNNKPEPKVENTVRWITKTTNVGEKLNFRLPDQTTVWLNSNSSLSFPESFDSTVRLVSLKGEGFFEVSEDAEHPFKVLSDSLVTTALGTSFNISIRSPDEITVSLVTGKVMINYENDTASYFLSPGKELIYKTLNGTAAIGSFNEEFVTGWRFGKLSFRRASLTEVVKTLEEWYGVEIKITGSAVQSWSFTGKFENQTLEDVLLSMSNIENFNYTIKNKQVNIQFNP
ncbi:FecR family protein [Algoriphagus pacificus]|uniref:DUF4974 domain-containing protein n=1 Tax=Algoriphagus pacificus TaxID=2811234 RepID=A0ABS3CGR8_9BACT|nr:FecR family protein [Algoriphagus pacificus]MBN7816227.1 DUF4974 domain-containing protein [Algoriphagus pacificus]